MKYNTQGLADVKPQLEQCVSTLESVKSAVSGLSAPDGFPCAGELSRLPNDISAAIQTIKSVASWVGDRANSFANADAKGQSIAESIVFPSGGNFSSPWLTGKSSSGAFGTTKNNSGGFSTNSFLENFDNNSTYKRTNAYFGEEKGVLARTSATIVNAAGSVLKRVADFGEALVDTGAIATNILTTPVTIATDAVRYLYTKATGGDTSNFKSTTNETWKNTMSFVSNDYVGTVYDWFYKDTKVGQTLDEYAYEPFKSDGVVSKFLQDAGYTASIIGLSALTGLPIWAISSIAAFGKYTEEKWGSQREEFESIKSLTNGQWSQIQNEYNEGNISKADFERMQEIRNSEDWRTAENAIKGMVYGAANAAWEGTQWHFGGELSGTKITSFPGADAVIRIGLNSIFNALDTPFRAEIEALTSDKTFSQAWEEQGGTDSLITNLAIGLLFSTGGEIFDNFKSAGRNIENNVEGIGENVYFQQGKENGLFSGIKNRIELNKMDKRIEQAKSQMKEYFNKKPLLGISDEAIDNAFKKVVVAKNNEEFFNYAVGCGMPEQEVMKINAFYSPSEDKVFFRSNNKKQTIIHEINHVLGNVNDPWLSVRTGASTRGVNEAFTDYLAFKQAKESFFDSSGKPKTGYVNNVVRLERFDKLLESAGWNDTVDLSYYTYGTSHFGNTLNKIVGRNDFYDEIVKNMDVADGWGKVRDINAVKQANIKLDKLIGELQNRIGG